MQIVPVDSLRRLVREQLLALGRAPDAASLVGDSLVDANLAGHDSHGVMRLLLYLEMVGEGRVAPYVEFLANQGMIGVAMSNAGRAVPRHSAPGSA